MPQIHRTMRSIGICSCHQLLMKSRLLRSSPYNLGFHASTAIEILHAVEASDAP